MASSLITGALAAIKGEGILKEIYGDLAKPGVSQVGKALGGIIGLGNTALWPIHLLNEKARINLEANLEMYREKMERTAPEDVTAVPPEVGVPIAEKLSYVTDDDIRDMYTTLLAKASTTSTQNLAHPSFIHIISNISPDEAILLKYLVDNNGVEPSLLVRLENFAQGTWIDLWDVYIMESNGAPLNYPENRSAYIRNLAGMGIINILPDIPLAPPSRYIHLEEEARSKFEKVRLLDGFTGLSLKRGKIETTRLGWMFINACLDGKNPLDGLVPC